MVRKFLLVLFLLLGGMAVGAAQGDVGTSPNSVAAKVFLFPDRLLQQHRLSAGRPHVSLPPTTPLFPDETFPAVKPYKYAGKEVDFVRFLLDSDLKQDALVLVRQGGFFPSDTLDYLCGKVYFSVRELDAAAQAFSTLHPSSPFYDEGLFYANAADAHMGRPEMALRRLQDYPGPYREMAAIQQAGLSLLCNDPAAYRNAAQAFTGSDFRLTGAEEALQDIYRHRNDRKSPFLGALYSTLLPGAGKVYAGRLGEGIASFLAVGTLGLATWDHARKDGISHWTTLALGSLCAYFYIGNIYGSYVSVSLYNQDLRNAQDTAILYHIHIPLRSLFR